MARLDPEVSFTPTVSEGLAPAKVLVAKSALGGQSIDQWYDHTRKDQKIGPLFISLMNEVNRVIADHSIESITFVWMQGESDANRTKFKNYQQNFTGLLNSLEKALGRKFGIVIGRINDHRNDGYWNRMRNLQMSQIRDKKKLPWVNQDDLNGPSNDLHLPPEGYEELGRRFGKECLAMSVSLGD